MMHWPQLMQGESASERSNTQPMEVEKPRRVAPMAPIFCILLQAAMQRRQLMHLELSRTMEGLSSSTVCSFFEPSKAYSSTPQFAAERLKLAVLRADAGRTFAVVVGKQQLQIQLARFAHARRYWS